MSNQSQANKLVLGNRFFLFLQCRGNEECKEDLGSYFQSFLMTFWEVVIENSSNLAIFLKNYFYFIFSSAPLDAYLPALWLCMIFFFFLISGRCCGQSPGKAKTSGTHNYEEPAYPRQTDSQPQQSCPGIRVRGFTDVQAQQKPYCGYLKLTQFIVLLWPLRLRVPDMSPKPQPAACDQRALRRTGEALVAGSVITVHTLPFPF